MAGGPRRPRRLQPPLRRRAPRRRRPRDRGDDARRAPPPRRRPGRPARRAHHRRPAPRAADRRPGRRGPRPGRRRALRRAPPARLVRRLAGLAADEWRHLRVNALEAQSDALRSRGRLHEAAQAARRAIEVDPLRETAQRCLISVHLAAGNQSDALQAYGTYRTRLEREVGLAPTAMLSDLISGMHQRSRALDRTG
ncbi:AfsR/SARP family transcriptional regulator [Clavibacter tessellarius]|uniref:AfsR/SARP family transcriptional regulator n=1 Tax=Clavibacter tessellarius TaxID=31965 RepID=UPI0032556455